MQRLTYERITYELPDPLSTSQQEEATQQDPGDSEVASDVRQTPQKGGLGNLGSYQGSQDTLALLDSVEKREREEELKRGAERDFPARDVDGSPSARSELEGQYEDAQDSDDEVGRDGDGMGEDLDATLSPLSSDSRPLSPSSVPSEARSVHGSEPGSPAFSDRSWGGWEGRHHSERSRSSGLRSEVDHASSSGSDPFLDPSSQPFLPSSTSMMTDISTTSDVESEYLNTSGENEGLSASVSREGGTFRDWMDKEHDSFSRPFHSLSLERDIAEATSHGIQSRFDHLGSQMIANPNESVLRDVTPQPVATEGPRSDLDPRQIPLPSSEASSPSSSLISLKPEDGEAALGEVEKEQTAIDDDLTAVPPASTSPDSPSTVGPVREDSASPSGEPPSATNGYKLTGLVLGCSAAVSTMALVYLEYRFFRLPSHGDDSSVSVEGNTLVANPVVEEPPSPISMNTTTSDPEVDNVVLATLPLVQWAMTLLPFRSSVYFDSLPLLSAIILVVGASVSFSLRSFSKHQRGSFQKRREVRFDANQSNHLISGLTYANASEWDLALIEFEKSILSVSDGRRRKLVAKFWAALSMYRIRREKGRDTEHDLELARSYLRDVMEADQGQAPKANVMAESVELLGKIHCLEADWASGKQCLLQALSLYDSALQTAGRPASVPFSTSSLHIFMAEQYIIFEDDVKVAREHLKQAINSTDSSSPACVRLALTYKDPGCPTARDCFRRAISGLGCTEVKGVEDTTAVSITRSSSLFFYTYISMISSPSTPAQRINMLTEGIDKFPADGVLRGLRDVEAAVAQDGKVGSVRAVEGELLRLANAAKLEDDESIEPIEVSALAFLLFHLKGHPDGADEYRARFNRLFNKMKDVAWDSNPLPSAMPTVAFLRRIVDIMSKSSGSRTSSPKTPKSTKTGGTASTTPTRQRVMTGVKPEVEIKLEMADEMADENVNIPSRTPTKGKKIGAVSLGSGSKPVPSPANPRIVEIKGTRSPRAPAAAPRRSPRVKATVSYNEDSDV